MKKKLLNLLLTVMLVLTVPTVFSTDTGTGIGIDITPEEFPVHIWMCDERIVLEDCVQAGRISDCDSPLFERINNYAFEGEQIEWEVLVMDKNKIEEVQEVVATIGTTQGTGNDIEVECAEDPSFNEGYIADSCNARILEEDLSGDRVDPLTQKYYKCIFTVETPESMQGEFFVTVEAISVDSEATIDENEFWFFNPIIALTVEGDVEFDNVRPGSVDYSSTILVGNDAEEGSGVLLDMFISGTDFYDPDSSGAKCPDSNRLKLSQDLRSQASLGADTDSGETFRTACDITQNDGSDGWINDPSQIGVDNHDHLCYYATSGSYSSAGNPNADAEGYRPIVYSDQFTRDFYNDAEIIWNGVITGGYSAGNLLTPGAEIAINFKLGLPEPCVGNFNEGDIFFWGEAV